MRGRLNAERKVAQIAFGGGTPTFLLPEELRELVRFDAGGASIVYSTDVNGLTEEMVDLFAGVDVWIVDALRRRPHPSHASLSEALDWIARVQPKRAILTHMDQSMDYRQLLSELPYGVEPGYDGMEVLL